MRAAVPKMSINSLLLFAVFGLLIWAALRMTRQTLQAVDAREARRAAGAASEIVVETDPDTGSVLVVSDDLDRMRRQWHPVRFPESWESRVGGFPREPVERDGSLGRRRAWCEIHCSGRWRVEAPNTPSPVFWFENPRDASDFSLAWFPFKCV